MERIYPAYKDKTTRNDEWARDNASSFAQQLNLEYEKARKSRSKQFQRLDKLPVRIYGSGDYIPEHYEFLAGLDFKFYIISKNLTEESNQTHIKNLLSIRNLTSICLSFDNSNLDRYETLKHLYQTDRFKFTYTGMADDFNEIKQTKQFDIFFNISKKKIEQEKSRLIKEQCPCDSGSLLHNKSCSFCNKCWRSSITRGKTWNTQNIKNQ